MTTLRIEFDLPVDEGLRQISGVGVVVRSEPISQVLDHYEIAVFLQDIAQPDRDTIEAYVESDADPPESAPFSIVSGDGSSGKPAGPTLDGGCVVSPLPPALPPVLVLVTLLIVFRRRFK